MLNWQKFSLVMLFLFVMGMAVSPVSAAEIMSIVSEDPDSVTIMDCLDREITIKQPVEKVVILDAHQQLTSALQSMGLYDKIVGIDSATAKEKELFPNIDSIPLIGSRDELDLEVILKLNPDVVFDVGTYPGDEIEKMEAAGLTVVSISLFPTNGEGFKPTIENTRVLGSIMGQKDKAEIFVNWLSHYLDIIEERVSGLDDADKPTALYTYKWENNSIFGAGNKNRFHYVFDFVGANDINSDLNADWAEIDIESVIKENPEFILIEEMDHKTGYGITDPSDIEKSIASLKSVPGLNNVDAVKNDKVYGIPMSVMSGDTWLGAIYLAPLFHPNLFKDFNPVMIHQQYMDNFIDIDENIVDDVFLYPKA